MSRFIDLTGQRFTRWTVVSQAPQKPSGQRCWLCRCDCGKEQVVQSGALRSNHSKSCGCLKVERCIERSTKHGHATGGITPTYHSWSGMIARCTDPNHVAWARYGGRGVKVCDRWLESFESFLADMREKPPGTSIDRYPDKNGNYEPGNCRWATDIQQANNRRTTVTLEIDGLAKTLSEWCEQIGIKRKTVLDRLYAGWAPSDALHTPPGTPDQNVRTHKLTKDGETLTLAEWSRRTGIPAHTILRRVQRGYSEVEALTP